MRYGDSGTVHNTRHVNVETDACGKVVAVWFRCLRLPFDQTTADASRAAEMRASYAREAPYPLDAVIVDDEPQRPPRADDMVRPIHPDKPRGWPFHWLPWATRA